MVNTFFSLNEGRSLVADRSQYIAQNVQLFQNGNISNKAEFIPCG